MFGSGGIDLECNLLSFCLVDLDKGLVSVDPMFVVCTSTWLVFDNHNLLASLGAGLNDRLELSDLLVVDLDLLVQISVDPNSNSVFSSDQMSLLVFSALDSNDDDL